MRLKPENLGAVIKKWAKASFSASMVVTALSLFVAGLALADYSFLFKMTTVAVAIVLLPLAPILTLLFYAALLAFAVPINDIPIVLSDFRFYVADFAFYLFACAGVYYSWYALFGASEAAPQKPRLEKWLIALVAINVAWGCVEVANGILIDGLEVRDAIGDFRRIYLYMLAILIPLGLPIKQPLLRRIPYAFAIGGAGAVLFGLHRLRTGTLYHSFTSHVDSPRVLGDAELVGLGFLLAYVIALTLSKANPLKKVVFLPLGATAIAFMAISGWRYGILMAVGVPISVASAFSLLKGIRLSRILGAATAAVVVVALGSLAVFGLFGETADYIWQSRRTKQQDLQGDARIPAYQMALSEFAQRPVAGTGLGHQLSYFAVSSDGTLLNRKTTTHNIFIDVLYQTGLVGLGLFLALKSCFAWLFLKRIRLVEPGAIAAVVALFIGYVFIVGLFCLEPSHVSTTMTMYLTMGLTVRALGEFSVKEAPLPQAPLA